MCIYQAVSFCEIKKKFKICADFANALNLRDITYIYAKFQEDWIIRRGYTQK